MSRLLDLVAEDNALEDTIYHLGRAFNADARTAEELERFLKVRNTIVLCEAMFGLTPCAPENTFAISRAVHAEIFDKQDIAGIGTG